MFHSLTFLWLSLDLFSFESGKSSESSESVSLACLPTPFSLVAVNLPTLAYIMQETQFVIKVFTATYCTW